MAREIRWDTDTSRTWLHAVDVETDKPLIALEPGSECSFDPETWDDIEGIDGPVIVCNVHGFPAPCDLPHYVDVYDLDRKTQYGKRWGYTSERVTP